MPRRPIVTVEDRNPFGEDFDESILNDPGRDSTYIEGYSDVRRDRELAKRRGDSVKPLRHRLQWARAKSLDGTKLDGRRIAHWQVNKKYKALPYDEAIRLGYRVDENPAIERGEDGNAYLGERMLMYCSGDVAAANYLKNQQANEDLLAQPQRKMEQAVEEFNKSAKGAAAEAFAFTGEDPDELAKQHKKRLF